MAVVEHLVYERTKPWPECCECERVCQIYWELQTSNQIQTTRATQKKWLYEKASRSKCKHKIVTETMCCIFANIKHQTLSRNCTFHHFSTYKFSAKSTSHRKGTRGCVCLRARHSILMKVSQTEIVWKLEARAKTRGAFAKMSFR